MAREHPPGRLHGWREQTHENRGEAKQIIWNLRQKDFRSRWRGYGFVIDLSEWEVAVPQSWDLPQPLSTPDYRVSLDRSFVATDSEPQGRAVIAGILRESLKKHFKENASSELGDLWQDFDSFCQYPRNDWRHEYLMCRRFSVAVKQIARGRLVMQTIVSTATVDGKTLADYYEAGDLSTLGEMIAAKREARLTRKNRPIGVRVLHQPSEGTTRVQALDLEDVEVVLGHAQLLPDEQRQLGKQLLRCRPFSKPVMNIPPWELRLILGSQIIQEDQAETIIEPTDRAHWWRKIRDFVDGCAVQGQTLKLSTELADADDLEHMVVMPPTVRVRGEAGREVLIPSPNYADERSLQRRGKNRMDHIRRYGFLVRRPINPALAWPSYLGGSRGARLKEHFEAVLGDQGIEATFGLIPFRNPEELRKAVERGGYDTVLAVLPEGSRRARSGNDTHEQIKRSLDVPSQCIQHDHTLPMDIARRDWAEIKQMDDRRTRRIRQAYDLTLWNLLVKHHWFPFAPYYPFHYNVHVGLDVGGMHNTHAVSCLGYGFLRPTELLLFLPEEIAVETQKKEPIPTASLYRGLLAQFERVHSELIEAGIDPDFESVLFHRDGALLGDGDDWNERDALEKLHVELTSRGWVPEQARWSVAEISKTAERWRLLRITACDLGNPLVGYAVFPFDDPNVALVATTGSPYLPQGTAHPLLVTISDICGRVDPKHVVQDIVWQADLCFTKPDIGMSLPWVLNVADSYALQLSRSYRISGITA